VGLAKFLSEEVLLVLMLFKIFDEFRNIASWTSIPVLLPSYTGMPSSLVSGHCIYLLAHL